MFPSGLEITIDKFPLSEDLSVWFPVHNKEDFREQQNTCVGITITRLRLKVVHLINYCD